MTHCQAVSSLGAPELSFQDFLALTKAHGINRVELRSLGGQLDLPKYLANAFGSPRIFGEESAGIGARIQCLGTSLRIADSNDEDRRAFLEYVPWAEGSGTPWLRVFDGGLDASEGEIAASAATIDWWERLRHASGWKVDLIVETHDSLLTGERIGRLAAASPGLRLLWDSHHTWRKGGESPATTWAAISERVCEIHVKDSVSTPGSRPPFSYVLPGEGEFPMAELRAALGNSYQGALCLEWEKRWHPDLPDLDAALVSAKAHGWW